MKRDQAATIGDDALAFESPEEREAFIEAACHGDPDLTRYVQEYLEGAGDDSAEDAQYLGIQIGPWTLKEVIGSGGFGVVFRAERQDPHLERAIKLLQGNIHSRDSQERFLRERDALAKLDHPNIVRYSDSGFTADGQPYLVMDYVRGALPIDVYCRNNHLSVRAKLEMFQHVCNAVSEAHKNSIIHRDLKPGNILVGLDGIPKLVDFNLARLVDPIDESGQNFRSQAGVGTRRYMSPEQVLGENVKTTTDVYSLGMVLYELLTGTDPYNFDQRTRSTVEAVICEVEAEPASQAVDRSKIKKGSVMGNAPNWDQLKRELRGDIDKILQMTLCKDPSRRYQSVDQFRQDLRNELAGLPVSARPSTAGYRFQKFLRRNKTLASVVGVASVLLIAGIVTLANQYVEEKAAKTFANQQEQIAKEQTKVAKAQAALAETKREESEERLFSSLLLQADSAFADRPWHALAYGAAALRLAKTDLTSSDKVRRNLAKMRTSRAIDWIALALQSSNWLTPIELPHSREVSSLHFSADGREIITVADKVERIWDVSGGTTLKRSLRGVDYASFCKDSRYVASSSGNTLRIRNASTGEVIHALETKEQLRSVNYDCSRAVSAAFVETAKQRLPRLKVWDVSTGESLGEPIPGAPLSSLSPSDQWIVAGEGGYNNIAYAYDVETGEKVALQNSQGFLGFHFSADSKFILATSSQTARVWQIPDGSVVRTLMNVPNLSQAWFSEPSIMVPGVHDPFKYADLSQLFTASLSDRSGAVLRMFGAEGDSISSLIDERHFKGSWVFHSTEGHRVAICSDDGPALVWDFERHSLLRLPVEHNSAAKLGTFSPDGKRLALAYEDGLVLLWNLSVSGQRELPEPDDPFVPPPAMRFAKFSSDGKRLAEDELSSLMIWEISPDGPLYPAPSHRVHLSPGALVCDFNEVYLLEKLQGSLRVRDVRTGRVIGKSILGTFDLAKLVPNGRVLAEVSDYKQHNLSLWNVETGSRVSGSFAGFRDSGYFCQSADGRHLIAFSASDAGTQISLWSTYTGKPVGQIHHVPARVSDCSQISDDLERVIIGSGRDLHIWDLSLNNFVGRPMQHDEPPRLGFLNSSKYLLTVAGNKAYLWDAKSGKALAKPIQETTRIFGASLSADGEVLFVSHNDGCWRLWATATTEPIGPPQCETQVGAPPAVDFSPDRTTLAYKLSGGDSLSLRLFRFSMASRLLNQGEQLAGLAEAVGGYRINSSGVPSPLTLRDRLETVRASQLATQFPTLKSFGGQ